MANDETSSWHLIISQGPNVGSVYTVTGAAVHLGRQIDNHVIIDNYMVSRQHARLILQGDTYLLEDLNSSNGTWVNDVRVTSPVLLQAGDVIAMGLEVRTIYCRLPREEQTTLHWIAVPKPDDCRSGQSDSD